MALMVNPHVLNGPNSRLEFATKKTPRSGAVRSYAKDRRVRQFRALTKA
jgi:hypothetical protein